MNLQTCIGVWGGIGAIANIFIYCYVADRMSLALYAINDVANQTQWYNYPREPRKNMILISKLAQRPVHFDGLKLMYCNLITFSSVSCALILLVIIVECKGQARFIGKDNDNIFHLFSVFVTHHIYIVSLHSFVSIFRYCV